MNRQAYSNAVFYIAGLDQRHRVNKKVGWVYLAHANELGDGVLKIGMTSRPPPRRAAELSRSTGRSGTFRPIYFVHVLDRYAAEMWVHRTLDEYRLRSWEEFFRVSLGTAVQTLDQVAARHPVPMGLPGKFGKSGTGMLPQVFEHENRECPSCGQANRIWDLNIPVIYTCKRCGKELHRGDSSGQAFL